MKQRLDGYDDSMPDHDLSDGKANQQNRRRRRRFAIVAVVLCVAVGPYYWVQKQATERHRQIIDVLQYRRLPHSTYRTQILPRPVASLIGKVFPATRNKLTVPRHRIDELTISRKRHLRYLYEAVPRGYVNELIVSLQFDEFTAADIEEAITRLGPKSISVVPKWPRPKIKRMTVPITEPFQLPRAMVELFAASDRRRFRHHRTVKL